MTMSDESALVALAHEYADAVRHRDAERWAATWVADGRWVLGPGRDVSGRDAIVEMWSDSIAKYAVVTQMYTSCTFNIDSNIDSSIGSNIDINTASGRCQLFELNVVADDGSRQVMAGHYDDTYRRTPEGWRYNSRQLTKYYSGPPDLTGIFVTPT